MGLILRISLVDVRGPPEEFYVELTECLGNVSGTVHSHREIGLWKWHPRWLITNSLHMPRSSMRLQTQRLKDSKLADFPFCEMHHELPLLYFYWSVRCVEDPDGRCRRQEESSTDRCQLLHLGGMTVVPTYLCDQPLECCEKCVTDSLIWLVFFDKFSTFYINDKYKGKSNLDWTYHFV